jgi:hypothetical protein
MRLRDLLEDRAEAQTGTAPGGPEVDQDDALGDGLVMVLSGQGQSSHDF